MTDEVDSNIQFWDEKMVVKIRRKALVGRKITNHQQRNAENHSE